MARWAVTIEAYKKLLAAARAVRERAGVSDRCAVQAGSFFDGVPAGCNASRARVVTNTEERLDAAEVRNAAARRRDIMPPWGLTTLCSTAI